MLATQIEAIKETRKAASLDVAALIEHGVFLDKMRIVLIPYLRDEQIQKYDKRIKEHAFSPIEVAEGFTGDRVKWIRNAESILFLRRMINENLSDFGCDNFQYWHFQRSRDNLNRAAHELMLKVASDAELSIAQTIHSQKNVGSGRSSLDAALIVYRYKDEWRFSTGSRQDHVGNEFVVLAWKKDSFVDKAQEVGGVDFDPELFDLQIEGHVPTDMGWNTNVTNSTVVINSLRPLILQMFKVGNLREIWK